MKKPKLLKTALTAALAATLLLPCAAAGAEMSAKEGAAEQPAYTLMQRSPRSFPIQVWGQAAELGDNSLTLQNDNEGAAYAKIVVNVEEDTKILDAVTGEERVLCGHPEE